MLGCGVLKGIYGDYVCYLIECDMMESGWLLDFYDGRTSGDLMCDKFLDFMVENIWAWMSKEMCYGTYQFIDLCL